MNVQLSLITPDGEPAPLCAFRLRARFSQAWAVGEELGSLGGGRGGARGAFPLRGA